MKRCLITLMILGLIVGSVATAEAKKKRLRSERTVEGSYDLPWMYFASTCARRGAIGCVSVQTVATERFLVAKVTDAHGQPVAVRVSANTNNTDPRDDVDFGTFCGETTTPISFTPGVRLLFYIALPQTLVGCQPGFATNGTLSVTLSNRP